MVYKLLLTATFLLNFTIAQAQVEKTFFQTYNIGDGSGRITIQANDTYELRPWNGVQLMIETTARLDGGNMDLLSILIKDGRYNFDFEQRGEGLIFHPKLSVRSQIKHLGQICRETVKLLIFVPDEFLILSQTELIRRDLLVTKNK